MNRFLWVVIAVMLFLSGAFGVYMVKNGFRTGAEVANLAQNRKKILSEGRANFLKLTGLVASDLEYVDFYENVMYQSERFGDRRYIFKAIIAADRVVYFQGVITEASPDFERMEIGFRRVKQLDYGADGRLKGISYGEQGRLSLSDLRGLILKERDAAVSNSERLDPGSQKILEGKKSLLPDL